MVMKKICSVVGCIAFVAIAATAAPSVAINKTSGIYKSGEEIIFTFTNKDAVSKNLNIETRLFINGEQVKTEQQKPAEVVTLSIKGDKPCWISAAVIYRENGKEVAKKAIGALVDPDKITPGAAEPADFADFWKAQKAALAKVPAVVTKKEVEVPEKFKDQFVCYDVQVDCAGGKPVSGYLTLPKGAAAKSCKIVVLFDGAGVRSAFKNFIPGTAYFSINAHGIPNGQSAEFYKKYDAQILRGYQHRGRQSRLTIYFRGMILRAVRALEYVKTLPEWDGKTLIVKGGSQGGGQALAAAALDNDVTHCFLTVPGLCDHLAGTADRRPGWPFFLMGKDGKMVKDPLTAKAVQYYDGCNFANYIKCPVWVSTGLIDFVCVPTSVYAFYNTLKVEKYIEVMPEYAHGTWSPVNNAVYSKIINGK